MTDEQTQVTENTETVTKPETTKEVDTKKNTNGYDRVEFEDPEIQKRFNRVYGQVKAQDRKYNQALEVMREQSEVIERLQKGVGKIVEHMDTRDAADTEASIKREAKEAFAKGDVDAYQDAMERLAETKAQRAAQEVVKKSQAQTVEKKVEKQQQQMSASEMAERGQSSGALTHEDVATVSAWQEERDADGNLLRPWAFPKSDAYNDAYAETAAIFTGKRYANWTVEQKLAEVDKRMGISRNESRQNVMGANLTGQRKNNNMKISPEIEKVMQRLGGSSKTKGDPLDWYRQQVQKVKQSNTGVRR